MPIFTPKINSLYDVRYISSPLNCNNISGDKQKQCIKYPLNQMAVYVTDSSSVKFSSIANNHTNSQRTA